MACQSLPVADWFPQHSFNVARQQWFTGACILTDWLLRVAYLKSCWTHESWEETRLCVTELLWCHWGGVWLQASHHRRSGPSHRSYHGKCGCAKIELVKSYWLLPRRLNYMEKCCSSHFLFQMFGMIFSMLLCCAIRKSREVVWSPQSHHLKSLLMLHDVIPGVTWLSTANRNTARSDSDKLSKDGHRYFKRINDTSVNLCHRHLGPPSWAI